ncbi:MAG: hypothetical protein JW843_12400 [Candidatus Aminicenantes bacterium]|nr:hypothetical protein [Candidatus Aminicenantes bacterium]
MLEPLLNSDIKEKTLLFIWANGESFPREIARTFGFNLRAVQYQLKNLEEGAVLYSKLKGKVRLYGYNPRYPFRKELTALLDKALMFYPESERARIVPLRLRPRRAGKPL